MAHRHLRFRVREIGSIRGFNVGPNFCKCGPFLPKFVHVIIEVYGSEFGNDVIYMFLYMSLNYID